MPFPVDEARLAAAEAALDVRFSEGHRARLLRDNGGEVEVFAQEGSTVAGGPFTLFPVFDGSERRRLGRTANHLLREKGFARDSAGFPEDAVAIAGADGDYLVMLRSRPGVFLWSHESGELEPAEVDWSS